MKKYSCGGITALLSHYGNHRKGFSKVDNECFELNEVEVDEEVIKASVKQILVWGIMQNYTKFERFLYTFLILLAVFIFGVQIGIAHGKELQRQEHYEYITTN